MASAVSAVIGFAWANYRVFQKQEDIIWKSRQKTELPEVRTSQLRITTDKGSRYILRPVSNTPKGDFNEMFLEFHLMIENMGERNSSVNCYQVEIVELRRSFADIRPREGLSSVQGRHCVQGLNSAGALSSTGVIRIAAESTTDHGTLFFSVSDVSLEMFAAEGLHMRGPERKFPDLHCRLTLTDTTGSSATAEFELHEA